MESIDTVRDGERRKMIEEFRSQHAGKPELVHRKMKFIRMGEELEKGEVRSKDIDAQHEKVKLHGDEMTPGRDAFRVMQWNILADALTASIPDPNFNMVPSECLEWGFRKPYIMEHILQLNADIIFLEEMDHFHDIFEPLFTKLGFSSVFHPKKESPCLRNPVNNGPDGVTIFFCNQRYDCRYKQFSYLANEEGTESNQPVLLCWLFDRVCNKNLVVAVVHLKAKGGFEELRKVQAADSIKQINQVIQEQAISSPSVLLVGDFNGDPSEQFYDYISKTTTVSLKSAYRCCLGKEPSFTTWKFRNSKEFKRCIDYIWFSNESLKVLSYLDFPQEKDIPENRFPNFNFPSDHMSLCSDFEYL